MSEETQNASTSAGTQNTDTSDDSGKTSTDDLFSKGYGKGIDKGKHELLSELGFESPDDAKAFMQAKREEEERQAKEQGKYQELLEQREQEIETLRSYKERAEKFDAYEQERRKQLTEKLPDDKQDIAADLSLTKLEKFVELESAQPQTKQTNNDYGSILSNFGYKSLREAAEAMNRGELSEEKYNDLKRAHGKQHNIRS